MINLVVRRYNLVKKGLHLHSSRRYTYIGLRACYFLTYLQMLTCYLIIRQPPIKIILEELNFNAKVLCSWQP